MDPNVAWKRYLEALAVVVDTSCYTDEGHEARKTADEYRQALLAWIFNGGFEPDWTPNERLLFLASGEKGARA